MNSNPKSSEHDAPQRPGCPSLSKGFSSNIVEADRSSWSSKRLCIWESHKHGSYKHYYGARRPASGRATDPDANGGSHAQHKFLDARLSVMQEDWFRGLDYLDIGTNTGIDIDAELIQSADQKLGAASARDAVNHSEKVTFRCEDFTAGCSISMPTSSSSTCPFSSLPTDLPSYHTITCLSVIKHVHLKGGDAAIEYLFHRVYHLLHPGGHFILEPQPWRSYRKRKKASAEASKHFASIKLRPDAFPIYLTETVGFATYHDLGVPSLAPQGFKRPLWCFVKGEEVVTESCITCRTWHFASMCVCGHPLIGAQVSFLSPG